MSPLHGGVEWHLRIGFRRIRGDEGVPLVGKIVPQAQHHREPGRVRYADQLLQGRFGFRFQLGSAIPGGVVDMQDTSEMVS